MCAGGTGQGGVRGRLVGTSCFFSDVLIENGTALQLLDTLMHNLVEDGNANGIVCLSVCPTKLY